MSTTIPQPTTIELSDAKERKKQYNREYRQRNKERIKEKHKEWNQQNKEYNKKWREQNKERLKEWREQNKERLKERHKEWREQNKERLKEWREQNKERINEYQKEYLKGWRELNKERLNQHIQSRLKTDPLFRAKLALRGVISTAFRRIKQNKPTNTEALLGCTWEEARQHFESKFQPGMNWSNHGEWHIDHIKPVSAFTESDLHLINHITNLQPLWAEDNLSKGDRY